ncbi:MAG: oligosaccharide repeat unit polymerase [Actinomycetota bacterium]
MRGRTTIELRKLFSPLTLLAAIYVPLFVVYLLTSTSLFAREFHSVKHVSTAGVLYFTAALLLFGLGAGLGRGRELRRPLRYAFEEAAPAAEYARRRLAPFLQGLLLVSLAAYIGWFGIGSFRAGGPSKLVEAWLSNPFYVKTQLLRTVPGLTTLTQLAVAAVPLALAFGLLRRRGRLLGLTVAVVILACVRAFIFSERLAVLELAVPIVYIMLSERRVAVPKAVLWGLGLGVAVLAVFTATELRRTYVYTHNFSPTHVAARFFGYYVTSINNGSVVIDRHPAATPFANTGQTLWHFPVVSSFRAEYLPAVGTVSLRYQDVFGVDPDTYWPQVFAEEDLSYEYNVFTTPGFLAADFGWLALPVLLLLGIYSGALYSRARSSPFHRALYAVWLIGLLEFMRIMYFFDTRALPAYAAFGAVYISIARRARLRDPVTPPHRAEQPAAASNR